MMRNGFTAVCLLLLVACRPASTETTAGHYTLQGDTISIPGNARLRAKLKTATVQSQPYPLQIPAAGTVKAIPTQYAEIAPPFPGRITRSYLQLGMKTTPQTSLFSISSPDFIAAQKIIFQEKAQMQQMEKKLKRQQDLMANGVGTQKDLEEAQTAYEVEKKEYENAVIGIRMFKADPDKLSLGQTLVVQMPGSGLPWNWAASEAQGSISPKASGP